MRQDLRDIGRSLGLGDSLLDKMGVDGDALGAVVSLVNTDQSVRELKHVRPTNKVCFEKCRREDLIRPE